MRHRRLGRTGLEISEFTLGGGIVGGILIHPPQEVRLAALERAVQAGCDWIDTGGDYGQGESERALGLLLPEVTPRPRVSTKVRVDPGLGDLEGQIRRSLEASLTRLRTDRADLFQLHNQIGPQAGRPLPGAGEIPRPGGVGDVFDKL